VAFPESSRLCSFKIGSLDLDNNRLSSTACRCCINITQVYVCGSPLATLIDVDLETLTLFLICGTCPCFMVLSCGLPYTVKCPNQNIADFIEETCVCYQWYRYCLLLRFRIYVLLLYLKTLPSHYFIFSWYRSIFSWHWMAYYALMVRNCLTHSTRKHLQTEIWLTK